MSAVVRDALSSPAISQGSRRWLTVVALASAGIFAAAICRNYASPRPLLVWNASASAPVGLYIRGDESAVSLGDLVLVEPPRNLARFADKRHYLPLGVSLIKRVMALSGSTICGAGDTVRIDGRVFLKRRRLDGQLLPLPSWSGCHRLGSGEVFLAMENVPGSFDGRYFGPLPVTTIKGRLVPLWTR
ncbi:S26 family signal peptidase [Rhizomicrobium electricum]|uniref:S26 family signal peptidase n=1 Tax=Rhizomicrobium electricum TaxID=480070 RepID=UPI0014210B82|nr:S26 family signal peptidase [Rhizomicrobium electricum]NIJ46662.1 conjugative transfer signal peptidase TraF [Rhizomicrobium electricum]